MEILTLVLLLGVAVLVSAVISQFIPKVSLPLIQIALGVVISIIASGSVVIELEPDLFLVLFIAPLLYIEAKQADKVGLWKNIKPILSLAIGLVLITMLIIGAVLHIILPEISLAAAFALGAALGPTDAVAVTSLSKQVTIPERQWNVLKGELLLNDASGIVSFQFAITAAIYGSFSFVDASVTFLEEFFGGLIVGLLLSVCANWALRRIRDLGVDNIKFHVLYEIYIPFLVYLIAQTLNVSGIIAVVVAGLVNVISPRTISPSIARMNIVSTSVWEVLSFALNGFVFVLLGTQLPTSMVYAWDSATISNFALIAYTVLLTAVLLGIRFLWCAGIEYVHARHGDKRKFDKSDIRSALITALCGAKGTITLSILFTIPIFMATGERFPDRNIIIFLGCGVILCTLLISTFLVPVVAPKRERKKTELEARQNYYEALADILRNVIEQLGAQRTKKNRRATRVVIKAYQDRIQSVKETLDGFTPSLLQALQPEVNIVGVSTTGEESTEKLHVQTLEWEQARVRFLMKMGAITRDMGYDFLERLERIEMLISHAQEPMTWKRFVATVRVVLIRAKFSISRRLLGSQLSEHSENMRQLQIDSASYVVDILQCLLQEDVYPTEDISKLLIEYERQLAMLRQGRPSLTSSFRVVDEADEVRRVAYQMELEQIQEMYEADRITKKDARRMRENVFLMQMDLESD